MADIEYTYDVYGEELYAEAEPQQQGEDAARARDGGALSRIVNIVGAVASVALVAGVGVWGYKLMVRDVSGVPVVRALEGPMRVTPEDPGGQLADHQGLAVNAVAAGGTAEAPPERLALAPRAVGLTDEDMPMGELSGTDGADTTLAAGAPVDPDAVEKFRDGSIDALVRQLTDGVDPLSDTETEIASDGVRPGALEDDSDSAVEMAAIDPAVLAAPGLKISLRPMSRPAELKQAVARADVAEALNGAQNVMASAADVEVDAGSLSAGTRLAQLGAYDSPDVAREEWSKLFSRFGDYMEGKKRVIQKASSGGRTFYRLRAMGFDDLSDARRFCSALVAENADCIPVTVR
ncbi:SPOR domain-containing protein [Pseudodonghicola flavimaris]|uniref:SPOR domain-containing protein n=1 Tax=Pseudodonghicola flavimaris TaxID=3050036 RepID=A0ABT7EVG2_9RHOB|nr:SPOR domain-containing protein [Pseudodonghicola flavimaris]MDK3016342.1 SPOR domain-containing protein [Pseudodonghicola flavimaris]